MTDDNLFRHAAGAEPTGATLTVEPNPHPDRRVDPKLFGKFTEHLGWNVSKGIDAQVLYNPTFGRWRFRPSRSTVDGGFDWEHDPDRIADQIEEHARFRDLPDADRLREAYEDAAAFWWMRTGDPSAVTFSPDVGRAGDRAQRMEISEASAERPSGAFQWTYLPLHRTRGFEYEVAARAAEATTLSLRVATVDADGTPAETVASEAFEVGGSWSVRLGTIELPADVPAGDDDPFAVCVTASDPANVVLDHALLYPDDHVDGADPDIVERFRAADLPLHRWPGGNFVSGYDWRDGIGPVASRPTRPNPAWGGVEPNLFGTAEFVRFCEATGSEPMICVNAGDGTPEEAAAWVEYCNGDPEDTEFGRLRAEHGHPDPFDVTYWEIGNELYGHWQVNWTTSGGNADRYLRFADAMRAADPSIEVMACGTRDGDWNDRLLADAGDELETITDHVLLSGRVGPDTDPDDLYHAAMSYADQLGDAYRDLADRLRAGGVVDPAVAVTELQLFTDYAEGEGSSLGNAWNRSIPPNVQATDVPVPWKKTVSEALFDATVVHECVRTGVVDLLTHSATVNHGAGLQKLKERVWADPAYHGHAVMSKLAGGVPLGVDVECATVSTVEATSEVEPVEDLPVLDAMAVHLAEESALVLTLVHRASDRGAVSATVDLAAFDPATEAEVVTLAGESMDAENTYENPNRVVPETETATVEDGELTVALPPYSLTRVTVGGVDELPEAAQ